MQRTFKLWPEPEEGKKYGPTAKQRLLFIEDLPKTDTWVDTTTNSPTEPNSTNSINLKRPHEHPVDVCLFIGGARCFGINTPILMYDGTVKPVQDVVVGDQVMGPDSKPRFVTSLARGQDELYEVTSHRGETFICNENHVLSLQTSSLEIRGGSRKHRNRSSGSVVSMTVKEFLDLPKSYQQQKYKLYRTPLLIFDKNPDLLIDPYWLGLWLGDGDMNTPSVCTMEPEIKEYIFEYAKQLDLQVNVYKTNTNSGFGYGKASVYRITSGQKIGHPLRNKLANYLRQYNLIRNKHIPEIYKTASPDVRRQILAGLIDTDGHYSKSNGQYEVTQKSLSLIEEIVFLCKSLGLACTVKWKTNTYWKKRNKKVKQYKVLINDDCSKIPVKVARKIQKDYKNARNKSRTGFKVKNLGKGDYYGFSVSGPDELFVLGNFIVTSNSGKTCSATARGD